MHPPSVWHTQPKSGLTLRASFVVSSVITSGPVRLPLRSSPANLYVTLSLADYSPRKGRKPYGSQILHLTSLSACHHHYPGSPTGACSHYFPVGSGVCPKRRGSASRSPKGDFIPTSGAPSNTSRISLLRGCKPEHVHWISLVMRHFGITQALGTRNDLCRNG